MRPSTIRRLLMPLVALAACCATGCVQLHLHVQLHEDGGATVTETVVFSKRLLELEKSGAAALAVSPLLERPAVERRLQHMGKGVQLASHEISDAPEGGKQAVSVFRIADLRDFRYPSPLLTNEHAAKQAVAFDVFAHYETTWRGVPGGTIGVRIAGPETKAASGDGEAEQPLPSELQAYRELAPIAADLLDGFRIRLTFECYAKIIWSGFNMRDRVEGTNRMDLLDFAWDDLDASGRSFLDNEEIMVELLCFDFDGPNVLAHTEHWPSNETVPVLLGFGHHRTKGDAFHFRPSQPLFDRYFKGKAVKLADRAPEKKADFGEIGAEPWPPRQTQEKKKPEQKQEQEQKPPEPEPEQQEEQEEQKPGEQEEKKPRRKRKRKPKNDQSNPDGGGDGDE